MSAFETLHKVDVSGKVEEKNGLRYLSWAYAWGFVKERYPDANYTIYENKDGWNYHTDGRTAWVKTGVTIEGLEHIEYLPVMDNRNNSIPLGEITSFDVNKAIQRSLTKAIARHGLGLDVYAGEDLPDADDRPRPQYQPRPQYDAPKPQPSAQNPASPKQRELIAKLVLEKDADLAEFGVSSIETLTSKQASDLLDRLFKLPKPEKPFPKDDDLPF